MILRPLRSTLFPYTTLFRSCRPDHDCPVCKVRSNAKDADPDGYRNDYPMRYRYFFNVLTEVNSAPGVKVFGFGQGLGDRKSTRLNSSHANISYAVFCLKKKN